MLYLDQGSWKQTLETYLVLLTNVDPKNLSFFKKKMFEN